MNLKTCMVSFSLLMVFHLNATVSKGLNEDQPVTKRSPYKRMIHFNPLALTVGGFEMGYEVANKPKTLLGISLGYYLSSDGGILEFVDDYKNLNGMRIEFQYTFLRKPNNYIKNVYLTPFLNFKTLSAEKVQYNTLLRQDESIKKSATTVGFGYILGVRKSIFENIYLNLGIGGGIYFPVSGEDHNDMDVPFLFPMKKGVQFRANTGIYIAL